MTTGKELYQMLARHNSADWIKARAGMYVHKSGLWIENWEDPSFPWLLINSSGHVLGSYTTASRARDAVALVNPSDYTGRPSKMYT